jgi:RimJ/RimL family protein N-acetyltransferase
MKTAIIGSKVKLRKLTLSDINSLSKNINDAEIARWTIRIPYPYKRSDAEKFINRSLDNFRKKTAYDLAITEKDGNDVIGGIGLSNLDWEDKKAELGYWRGRHYWGQGFTTEAVSLFTNYAFNVLKLHRIYACTFDKNIASQRVLEKCGFQLEGTLREAMFKRNRYHDEKIYGLLKHEWKKPVG